MSDESPRKRRKRKPDPSTASIDTVLVRFTDPPIRHNKARKPQARPPLDKPKPDGDQPPE